MSDKYRKEPDKLERIRMENRNISCMIRIADTELCIDPSLPFLDLLGKKYTVLILGVIGNKSEGANFNEILRDIPFSSSTIISKRLKELVNLDIIFKTDRGDRTTYFLTEQGQILRDALIPLIKTLAGLGLHS
ncbi:MAG: helix-turn-helix domain-containing protein [Thermoplasmataceae archaeon]